MQFVNPIWLWGLAGLLIPAAIHLLSRKEGKVIKIGSVRHLEDTLSKQFKSIRLNELALLALRCLLIAILTLFLAGLQLGIGGKEGKWLLIENGLENDREFSSLIDSLKKNGFEVKSLKTGFPELTENHLQKRIDYWSLVDELKTQPIEQAIVLSYSYHEGFKGKRPSLPENVTWISKNPDPVTFKLRAVQSSKDSVLLREGNGDAVQTNFSNAQILNTSNGSMITAIDSDSVRVEQPDTVSIAIVSDSSFIRDAEIVHAALHALDKKSPDVFQVKRYYVKTFPSSQKAGWIVWLSEQPPPRIENQNLIYFLQLESKKLFDRVENATWILTQRLNEKIALQDNLTVMLALILTRDKKSLAKANQFDKRILPENELWSSGSASNTNTHAQVVSNGSEKILFAFFVLVLLVERWIAFKRNQ